MATMNRFHAIGIALGLTAGVTAFVSGAQHPSNTLPPVPAVESDWRTKVSYSEPVSVESVPVTQQPTAPIETHEQKQQKQLERNVDQAIWVIAERIARSKGNYEPSESYKDELRMREDYQYFVMYDKLSDKVALCRVELNIIKANYHYSLAHGAFTPEVAKEFSDKHLKRTNNCYGTISG
jgi:hypothetical protein